MQNANANFYSLLADMYIELPGWSDKFMNGYFSFGPSVTIEAAGTDPASKGMMLGFSGYMHNHTSEQLNEAVGTFVKKMNNTNGIKGSFISQDIAKQSDILGTDPGYAGAGYNIAISSRLWPKEALTNKQNVLDFFDLLGTNSMTGLLISGPGLRDVSDPSATSVTPAWRRTYLHQSMLSWSPIPWHTADSMRSNRSNMGLPQCQPGSDSPLHYYKSSRESPARNGARYGLLLERGGCV